MAFTAEFKGLKSLQKKLNLFTGKTNKVVLQALADGALKIHSTAVKSIQDKKGQAVVVGGKRRIVSFPGDPPNTQTGRLVRSIRFDINATKVLARVFSKLDYGTFLEFGTRDIKARPWLRPAFKKHKKAITSDLNKRLKKLIKVADK